MDEHHRHASVQLVQFKEVPLAWLGLGLNKLQRGLIELLLGLSICISHKGLHLHVVQHLL